MLRRSIFACGIFVTTGILKGLIIKMFLISKEEAAELRRRCPQVHIVRTMKQKSNRGNYFCEETVAAIRVIRDLRASTAGASDE